MNFILQRGYHYLNRTSRRILMESKFGPPINRGMTQLDRLFFQKRIDLYVAYFPQPQYLGRFVKEAKCDILNIPSVKHVVNVDDSKGVLLRGDLEDPLKLAPATTELLNLFGAEVRPYVMDLDYSFWKTDDILRAVLPEDLLDDVPLGYAQAGHVAHLNLRDEFKPYGELIGQVILDKNPKIETVVDKINTIDTKFRTFPMKLLAGRNDLNVEQLESGCRFRFDFSKVYWNLRLSTEHDRLISQFKLGEVVGDVFAGVGPFAVPAGKKGVFCLANDLNPESYKSLVENIDLNKTGAYVKPFNLDGREFIRQLPSLLLNWQQQQPAVKEKKVTKKRKTEDGKLEKYVETLEVPMPKYFAHYVMNLPDLALTFLDEFQGLYADVEETVKADPQFTLPMIHCHCFEKYSHEEQPEPSQDEIQRRVHVKIQKLINYDLPYEACSFHLVRKVAPTKPMFCVSFKLPEEVAFRKRS